MQNSISLENIQLEKFSYTGKKVVWAFTVPTDEGVIPINSPGDTRRPHADLVEALKRLAPTLAKYAEEKVTKKTPVTLQELTFTREKGREGWKLKGRQGYEHSHGEKVLEPPIRFKDNTDQKAKYTPAEVALIEAAVVEMILYIRGKSGQIEMFEKRKSAGGEPNGDGASKGEPELVTAKTEGV